MSPNGPVADNADHGSNSSVSTEDPRLLQANVGCMTRLQERNLIPAARQYQAPLPPGTSGTGVEIQTNIFGIEVTKTTTIFQYVLNMKASLTTQKEAIFTKKGKEDFTVRDRHAKCCDILFHAVSKHPEIFKMEDNNHLVYDGQSLLYSTVDLFPGIPDIPSKKVILEINGEEVANDDLKTLPCIFIDIHAAKVETFVLSAESIARRSADRNIRANNRAYTMFLELVLNQTCIKETSRFGCFEHGKIFCLKPWEESYIASECPDVGDGKSLLPGLKKSIQFIEGPYGRGQNNPCVVIDAMKAAFHKEQLVYQKVGEILGKNPAHGLSDFDRERVTSIIRGLHCRTEYTGRNRYLQIDGIHHASAKDARFELKEGNSCTVEKYIRDKYNVTLSYPDCNLVVCKERGNKNFYPMELLTIEKYQRVTIPQQTSNQSQKTTRECAVAPLDRQNLIIKGKNAADISETNELLLFFGIKVYDYPMKTTARTLNGKTIEFRDRKVESAAGKWRAPPSGFFKPANWPAVWATYAVGTPNSRFTEKDLYDLSVQFVDACQKKGIKICQPGECRLVPADKAGDQLNYASDNGCKFVLIVTDDNITHLHQKYKLFERDHGMVVQDMKMSKAISVLKQNKRLTLENVVNKTNVKLGGLNHNVIDQKRTMTDEQLIIGIGLSAPVSLGKFIDGKEFLNPLIIGYASNAKSTHEFTGDFLLSPSGQDTFPSVEEIVKNCVEAFQSYRGRLPRRVIIYRSGASEGSHGSLLSFEIPLARLALQEANQNIKLVYIVVTKDHSYRFFKDQINPTDRPTEQNITAGVVLDTSVTHPACKQFFLNSHITLQGTAKTSLYTVLADDSEESMDTLEELTYTLCHHHQIVAMTTSVPTPLYVANEYAKRGRNLFTERTNGVAPPISQGVTEQDAMEQFTRNISYKEVIELVDKRVNA